MQIFPEACRLGLPIRLFACSTGWRSCMEVAGRARPGEEHEDGARERHGSVRVEARLTVLRLDGGVFLGERGAKPVVRNIAEGEEAFAELERLGAMTTPVAVVIHPRRGRVQRAVRNSLGEGGNACEERRYSGRR